MVNSYDKIEPVNMHNTYLILVQGLIQNHYCGCPELLNDYKQLWDEVFMISRIIKVEVRVIKNKGLIS